ncbi:unnamed protein product [Musa acuminata var. zebrina]
MDIHYRINGTRQTRGIAAESTEVGEYFNSISRYYIFKDDVTVLTQLSLGTNNRHIFSASMDLRVQSSMQSELTMSYFEYL